MSSAIPKPRNISSAPEASSTRGAGWRKRRQGVRISAACEACKKRKTKCTGGPPPCQLCKSLNTECVIDLTLDMRRRAALQRTIDESKIHQEVLNGVLQCIRSNNEPLIRRLLEYVQDGATNSEVAAFIEENAIIFNDDPNLEQPSGLSDAGDDSNFDPSATVTSLGGLSSEIQYVEDSVDLTDYPAILLRLRNSSDAEGEALLQSYARSRSSTTRSSSVRRLGEPTSTIAGPSNLSLNSQLVDGYDDIGKVLSTRDPSWQSSRSTMWSSSPQVDENINAVHFYSKDMTSYLNRGHDFDPFDPTLKSSSAVLSSKSKQRDDSMPDQARQLVSRQGYESSRLPFLEGFDLAMKESMTYPGLNIVYQDPRMRLRIPLYLLQPLIVSDDSYISLVYTNYWQGAQKMIADGVPLIDVIGRDDEVVVNLFFRKRIPTDRYDCSSWASELCRSFAEENNVLWLANAMLLTFLMRWLLVPNAETFANVPAMAKPTPTQCMIPHPSSIEVIPIPQLRDAVILKPRDWMAALRRARCNVNWPYSIDEALDRDPATGSTRLTRNFIEHTTNLSNWSVGQNFFDTFPDLIGSVRVHD